MSEALSSSEIEDVLSSIRRLVSDDLRPTGQDRSATTVPEANKLLLTPALRVVQPSASSADDSLAPAVDDFMANLDVAGPQQDDEWEPETGDLTLPNAVADDVAATDWQDQHIEDYVPSMPAEQRVDQFEQEEILADPTAATAEMPPGWAQTEGADEAEAVAPDPWVGGTVEPDPSWADEAEAAVLQELTGAPLPQTDDDYDEHAVDTGPDAEVPVDEAMLREIVRDVLREELQGRLGERITRNIRKLVRAEIARVMAAEELF